jgi:hypothetical protein
VWDDKSFTIDINRFYFCKGTIEFRMFVAPASHFVTEIWQYNLSEGKIDFGRFWPQKPNASFVQIFIGNLREGEREICYGNVNVH